MPLQVLDIEGLILYEPQVFSDERGFFFEAFNLQKFEKLGLDPNIKFVQLNHSKSIKGVLRGLHFQKGEYAQDKLVRVIRGKVLDIAVDLRKNSPTFGKYAAVELSSDNKKAFFIPKGFAHGFLVLSDDGAEFEYMVSNFYSKENDRGLVWNDPDVAIQWPIQNPILSEKDKLQPTLKELIDKGDVFE